MSNVLLIDDEPDVLSILNELLELMEQTVFTATCGDEAIEICKSNDIEIVITDYEMPDINGFELAKKINNIKSGIDIYLLSGYAKMLTKEQLAEAGIKRVLDKPFKMEDIQSILR